MKMTKSLREGLEGCNLKSTLRLYIWGIMALAPISALIGFLSSAETVFKLTPILAAVLGAIVYGICYLPDFRLMATRKPDKRVALSNKRQRTV